MKNHHFLLALIALMLFASCANAQRNASYVLGASDLTSQGELILPYGVYVSPVSGKIFVTDTNRLLRYTAASYLNFGAEPEIVFEGNTSLGNGTFYTLAAIYIDKYDSLWAADYSNNRVFKVKSISTAISLDFSLVLGQPDYYTNDAGSESDQLNFPLQVIYDCKNEVIWIADFENYRVNRYDNAKELIGGEGYSIYLGNGESGVSQTSVGTPTSLTLDDKGNLYVADLFNSRVLRFDDAHTLESESPASLVLGQPDFDTAEDTDPRSFASYYIFWFDDNLYVSDTFNNRVVIFEYISKLANGAYPSALLGQPDFDTTDTRPISASTFEWPVGIYVSDKLLYVASYLEGRVVVYTEPKTCPRPRPCHRPTRRPCQCHCPCPYNPPPCKYCPPTKYNTSWGYGRDKDGKRYDPRMKCSCYPNGHDYKECDDKDRDDKDRDDKGRDDKGRDYDGRDKDWDDKGHDYNGHDDKDCDDKGRDYDKDHDDKGRDYDGHDDKDRDYDKDRDDKGRDYDGHDDKDRDYDKDRDDKGRDYDKDHDDKGRDYDGHDDKGRDYDKDHDDKGRDYDKDRDDKGRDYDKDHDDKGRDYDGHDDKGHDDKGHDYDGHDEKERDSKEMDKKYGKAVGQGKRRLLQRRF